MTGEIQRKKPLVSDAVPAPLLPSSDELLSLLASTAYTAGVEIGPQARLCPHYVPLSGELGSQWGVILNPESSCFGGVVFERDDCGCPLPQEEGELNLPHH